MNKLALPLIAAVSLAATQAVAGPKHRYTHEDQDYGKVLAAEPIYRQVRIEEPRRECWDERVVYEDRSNEPWLSNGAAGAVVGAVIGGIAGHQVGGGRGRDAATAVGAILGAGVGQRVAVNNQQRPYERAQRVGYEERCETITDYRVEQRIEAYDVTYSYGGRTYHTTLPYDPGERIPVSVDVRPVRY
ncbi:MAG: glycine zipper 2TM domain-containing protein [Panacagrimonas sp.]